MSLNKRHLKSKMATGMYLFYSRQLKEKIAITKDEFKEVQTWGNADWWMSMIFYQPIQGELDL